MREQVAISDSIRVRRAVIRAWPSSREPVAGFVAHQAVRRRHAITLANYQRREIHAFCPLHAGTLQAQLRRTTGTIAQTGQIPKLTVLGSIPVIRSEREGCNRGCELARVVRSCIHQKRTEEKEKNCRT